MMCLTCSPRKSLRKLSSQTGLSTTTVKYKLSKRRLHLSWETLCTGYIRQLKINHNIKKSKDSQLKKSVYFHNYLYTCSTYIGISIFNLCVSMLYFRYQDGLVIVGVPFGKLLWSSQWWVCLSADEG